MAAVDVGMRHDPPIKDDLDDLFNYHVDENIYKDVDTNMDVVPKSIQAAAMNKEAADNGLGLEQEVKVRKARQPVPKLDETRLLSQAGVPKLRRLTKERLRFKGKGHEFSDIARMLNLYQLWLDDLYPRAKFADGLLMIEKLGHTKRMQVMRKEWIKEGQAKHLSRIGETNMEPDASTQSPEKDLAPGEQSSPAIVSSSSGYKNGGVSSKSQSAASRPTNLENGHEDSLFLSEDEGERSADLDDDLDAIMAEEDARQAALKSQPDELSQARAAEDDFDDEEAAMRDMENMDYL